MNIEDVVKECALDIFDGRGVEPTIRNALTKQAEAFKGELQAYDGMVRELTKTVEDMQAAQFVPVVGDVLFFASESTETADSQIRYDVCADKKDHSFFPVVRKPTASIPAAELATLREKAAEADELRKDAERYRWLRIGKNDAKAIDLIEDHCDTDLDSAIDAAIAHGKGG